MDVYRSFQWSFDDPIGNNNIIEHLKEDPQGSELKKKSLPRQVDFAVGQVTFHVHFPMGKSQARHLPTIL